MLINPYMCTQDLLLLSYVLPEISIKKNKDGSLTVSLMNDFIPSITIDDEYIKLLNTTNDPNTKKYLDSNKKKAESLISALEERDGVTLVLRGKIGVIPAPTKIKWKKI